MTTPAKNRPAAPAGAAEATSGPRAAGTGFEPAVTDRDRPRTGTVAGLTRRRWATIVPRAVVLLAVIGGLVALAVGVVVVVVGLVLAATAG